METIRSWISGICAVSLLIAIIRSIVPNGAMSSIVRTSCALLLVIATIAPIKRIDFNEFRINSHEIENELSDKINEVSRGNQKLQDSIIESQLAEYICKRAGIANDDIKVKCSEGEIKNIVLYTGDDPKTIKIIEEECGIERENIIIKSTRKEE